MRKIAKVAGAFFCAITLVTGMIGMTSAAKPPVLAATLQKCTISEEDAFHKLIPPVDPGYVEGNYQCVSVRLNLKPYACNTVVNVHVGNARYYNVICPPGSTPSPTTTVPTIQQTSTPTPSGPTAQPPFLPPSPYPSTVYAPISSGCLLNVYSASPNLPQIGNAHNGQVDAYNECVDNNSKVPYTCGKYSYDGKNDQFILAICTTTETPNAGVFITVVQNCADKTFSQLNASLCQCEYDSKANYDKTKKVYTGAYNENTETAIGCLPSNFGQVINIFVSFLVALASAAALIFMIIGGYEIMTHPTGSEQIAQGKTYITNAIIGLLVVLFCVLLLKIIGVNILGINALTGLGF